MKRPQIDPRSIFHEAVRMCSFDHFLARDAGAGFEGSFKPQGTLSKGRSSSCSPAPSGSKERAG